MTRRETTAVVVFVLLSWALAWGVALHLWLGEGLMSRGFVLTTTGMMMTPTIAAVLVVLFVEKPASRLRALGIWPLGRTVARFIGWLALGLAVPIGLVLVALPIGSLLGVYEADLESFSAYREVVLGQLAATGESELPISIEVLVISQLLAIPVGAVINLLPALGEEIGWRGWLFPRLLRLGTVPAIAISGVVWGIWHAPVVLLGYNYPSAPGALGVVLMVIMCTLVGAVFGWLRMRSDSVWPAALAHAAFNAAAGSSLLFARAGEPIDTVHATILGWSGWIVPAILVVVLVATGRFRAPQDSAVSAVVGPEHTDPPREAAAPGR